MIKAIIIDINTEVIKTCPAAYPSPIAMARNRQTSSSGSLMGVLKRTIESAPTKPRDKASEDLTITITKKTVTDKIGIIDPIWLLPVNENDLLKQTSRKTKDMAIQRKKLNKVGRSSTWVAVPEDSNSRRELFSESFIRQI